jgi:phosphoribosyl 1,2-cyclic phosphodiesterase
MRYASLGSGSKGNATLVATDNGVVLVDCGFSVRETVRRLARLRCNPEDLDAILVTHEHSDHIRGVVPLARKYGLPVFMTAGTAKAVSSCRDVIAHEVNPHRSLSLAGFDIIPVAVPHDAREPVQYIFRAGGNSLGILTDLGCITPHVIDAYGECDGLLLEANHDVGMLANGPYPPSLKRRVGGRWGHLSNDQAAALLAALGPERIQSLVLAHISEKNNARELVSAAVAPHTAAVGNLTYACQAQGFPWQTLL